MKINGLMIAALVGSMTPALHAQDAAPPSVDLYSGQQQPEVTTATSPEPTAPNVPELSQLDEAFKQRSLGKEADAHRLHIEWRRLKNQVANDPLVRAAEAATHGARTDLEKRKLLRDYYNVYYERMSALASTVEMKLALESLKTNHLGALAQPRVRPSPSASPASDAARVANLNLLKQAERPSPSASPALDAERVANLNSPRQAATRPVNPASSQTQGKVDSTVAAKSVALSTFLMAMNLPREVAILKENAPVTVFAPTDDAFQKAPPGTIDFPLNAEKIGKLLDYHIVKGAVTSNQLTTRKAPTINGASLDIKVINGEITVNDAHVIKADVKAPVGVIYVIDKVLIPPAE